ncbi:MAG TPA: ATP-dependent DNA helicase RecG [Candidatus Paceibacterota bacterium]|nr:ATP-dependent DNA helicase RecG [Candidatus Paceibacterota bacterium]
MGSGRFSVDLSAPVASLRYVGARTAARLERLGITTVRRLLWHVPSRYEDYRQSVPVRDAANGQTVSLEGVIEDIATRVAWRRRRMTVTTATLRDDSGDIRLVWFNQPYLTDTLAAGTAVSVAGKVRLDKRGLFLSSPVYEKTAFTGSVRRHTGRLIPVYPETEGVTSKFLRYLIQPLLEYGDISEYLPDGLRETAGLPGISEALLSLHYPADAGHVPAAKRRLAFDDLLLFQIRALRQRRAEQRRAAPPLAFDRPFMRRVVQDLPWELTRDQKVALVEVLQDIERPFPMNRLIQGDVGSGKTVVALAACVQVAQHGMQSVILSPTETLAQQHYATARKLMPDRFGRIALLTGSQALLNDRPVDRSVLKLSILRGSVPLVIGTHAVIQKNVRFGRLGFVVVDEQHRFGIAQRAALVRADRTGKAGTPHLLSMTATPIPRTLSLTVFGDLDISTIRSKPAGRKPVRTALVETHERSEMEQFIRDQVKAGRQVFVICPAIETPDANPSAARAKKGAQTRLLWAQAKAVQDEHKRLAEAVFPDLKIAMLHGRMKPKEKQSVMSRFRDGWHDVLVSTSVIEVGVDVPNATVMVVENADRFGLAQLHQFRGRIGRGEHASWCFLIPSADATAHQRLDAMVKTDDGFELAEHDLRIRGPGEFFGIKQSGTPDLTMAALADLELVQSARTSARALLKESPDLAAYPLLAKQLDHLSRLSHSE